MRCVLCAQPVDLTDLADGGWLGEPAHQVCARAAQRAFDEACERIATENRRRLERLAARRADAVA